jgi:hypothetical protein
MHSSNQFCSTSLYEKLVAMRWFHAVAFCVGCLVQAPTAVAGGLFLNGKINGYFEYILLENYGTKAKGSIFADGWKCISGRNGLTVSEYSKGAFMDWEKDGDRIKIISTQRDARGHEKTTTSFIAKHAGSTGIIEWQGKDVNLDGHVGDFEGRSSIQVDTAIGMKRLCDDNIESSGLVVAIIKPEMIDDAKKYFREQGWKRITEGTPVSAPSPAKNVFLFDVPVGSDRRIINQLRGFGFVLDAGRDYLIKSVPRLGYVLLPGDKMSSSSMSTLQAELQSLVNVTFGSSEHSIQVVPQLGNSFEVDIRGPLSQFVNKPTLPGFWIDTKLQVLVDPVNSGTRLLVNIREALLIRWPETGKGSPPKGFGTKLECESEGEAKNMTAAIAITNKLLRKANDLYSGKDYLSPYC